MNERTYCMLLHFSVFAGYAIPLAGLIVPIVLWQLKKNEMPSVDAHGKMVLNFILSAMLYAVVCGALVFRFYWHSPNFRTFYSLRRASHYRGHQSQRWRALEISNDH